MIQKVFVDFNEMVDFNLILLSQTDIKKNLDGEDIILSEGLKIEIYEPDYNEAGERDDIVANGVVEKCELKNYTHVKWCCRIDGNGIRHFSDL